MTVSRFSNTNWLKERARSLNSGLLGRFEEYVWDYPTDTPKELIDLLKASLRCISKRIDSATDERYLVTLIALIRNLTTFLTFFDNAHTEQTPRALPQMLEDLAKRLSNDVSLVVWPQVEYNFTIRDILPRLKKALDNVLTIDEKSQIFDKFKGRIDLVSFPRIERENIFVHAIFGHELGHPIADQFLLSERTELKYVSRLQQAKKEIFTHFAADLKRQRTPIRRLQLEKELTDSILKIRSRGLQELVSDVVAIYLFGPSAIFSAFDVFAGEPRDVLPVASSEMYPPDRMRFRTMFHVLRNEGFVDSLRALKNRSVRESVNELLEYIESETNNDADQRAVEGQPLCKVAYAWIRETLPDAIAFAKKMVGNVAYLSTSVDKEVSELLSRLELAIPANEAGNYPNTTTIDWRSSILSAWLWRLNRSREATLFGDKVSDAEIKALQRITSMSIELSLLKTRYLRYSKLTNHS